MRHPEAPFAATIQGLRQERGWSQRRLAAELGVDHATVGRWESGASEPTAALRVRLEVFIGHPISPATVLGAEIRDLRYRLGLSQADLAEQFGMTQPTLSRIENGSLQAAPEISRALRERLGHPRPLDELPTASLALCEASYEAYWRACAVFDHPDGAAWGAGLSGRLLELSIEDRRAKSLLARVYASRAYWHLARGQHRDVERMARHAIRLGIENGFDLTSGYALWAWARTRFNKRRITPADRHVLGRLRKLAHRRTGPELPYADLIAAAHDRTIGRPDEADDRLNVLSERPFPNDEPGQFGDLYPDRRWATYQSYRAMFRLAERDDEGVLAVADAVSSDDTVVGLILGAYRHAALARLGSSDAERESALALFAQERGHGFAYQTVLDHTRKITGI